MPKTRLIIVNIVKIFNRRRALIVCTSSIRVAIPAYSSDHSSIGFLETDDTILVGQEKCFGDESSWRILVDESRIN